MLCGVIVGILFLEETHEAKKLRRDPGLEVGKWILNKFSRCTSVTRFSGEKSQWETVPLLNEEDQPPGYRTATGSPTLHRSTTNDDNLVGLDLERPVVISRTKPAVTKAFTSQVIRNIMGYGILA